MKYLIDTQILIWLFISPNKIPSNIQNLLKNLDNEIYVSKVSIWEIAIQVSIGKLIIPFEIKKLIFEIKGMNIKILNIKNQHLIKVTDLPFHHKDPFDRLIISQAFIERMTIISSDNHFSKYDVKVLW